MKYISTYYLFIYLSIIYTYIIYLLSIYLYIYLAELKGTVFVSEDEVDERIETRLKTDLRIPDLCQVELVTLASQVDKVNID